MKKDGFLTFIFACIPGAGAMYYGYMKRGVSLITLCCVGFGLGSVLPPLMVLPPIVWMFSFFDTYDLIRRAAAGNPKEDDFLLIDRVLDGQWLRGLQGKYDKIVGWVLVGVGAWILYDSVIAPLLWTLGSPYLDDLPTIVVAALLIFFGVRLLGGRGHHDEDSHLPPYPGPDGE